jgi:hypothetical protein
LIGLVALELVIFTRTAVIVTAIAVLANLARAYTRWIVVALIGGFYVYAAYFTYGAMTISTVGDVGDLNSRRADILYTRLVNLNRFFPWGGTRLDIYDAPRARVIPATSNNLGFDLWWKLGIMGFVLLAIWIYFLWVSLPKISGASSLRFIQIPAGVGLVLLPAASQLNNQFNWTWTWTLSALLFAVVCSVIDSNRESLDEDSDLAGEVLAEPLLLRRRLRSQRFDLR